MASTRYGHFAQEDLTQANSRLDHGEDGVKAAWPIEDQCIYPQLHRPFVVLPFLRGALHSAHCTSGI